MKKSSGFIRGVSAESRSDQSNLMLDGNKHVCYHIRDATKRIQGEYKCSLCYGVSAYIWIWTDNLKETCMEERQETSDISKLFYLNQQNHLPVNFYPSGMQLMTDFYSRTCNLGGRWRGELLVKRGPLTHPRSIPSISKGKIIEPEIICSMHSMHCTIAIAYQIFASFFCDVKKYTLKSHTVCRLVHLI